MKLFTLLLLIFITSCSSSELISISDSNFIRGDSKLVVVNVNMNGNRERFLIDTGSTSSYISSGFLKNERCFKLAESKASYATLNSYVDFKTVKVKVTIEGKTYWFNTINLFALNNHLKTNSVIGILGSDFLAANRIIIDYSKNKIYQFNK